MEPIIKNIVKKFTCKVFLISFLFTLIFVVFSQHLYVNSNYFQATSENPIFLNVECLYQGAKEDFSAFAVDSQLKIRYLGKKDNKNSKRISISLYNHSKTYNFKIFTNNIDEIEIRFFSEILQKINIESLKINNKKIPISKIENGSDFVIKIPKTKNEYNIQLTGNKTPELKNWKILYKNINKKLFIFIFLVYFFVFLALVDNFLNEKKRITFNKKEIMIFIAVFLLYSIYNLKTSCFADHFAMVKNDWHYWLSFDESAIIKHVEYSTSRRYHPYFFLPFYPIFEFLMFLTKNLFFSLSVMWYFFASFSALFLYKTMDLIFCNFKEVKYLFLLIYVFSLTQLIMSSCFEIYIITGFYLSVLVYLIIKELKNKEEKRKNIIIIALISSLMFGVTISNLIPILILVSSIFFAKRNFKNIKIFLISFFIFTIIFTSAKSIVDNGAAFKNFYDKNSIKRHVEVTLQIRNNFEEFRKETLLYPLIYYKKEQNPAYLFWFIFVLLNFYYIYFNFKNKKTSNFNIFYITSFSALLYNYVVNFFWYSSSGFLFAQNYFILLFVLLAISANNFYLFFKEKNRNYYLSAKNILIALLAILLIFEIILNSQTLLKQNKNKIEMNPYSIPQKS